MSSQRSISSNQSSAYNLFWSSLYHQVREFVRLLRPYQWIKSGFVLTGLLFSKGWHDPTLTLWVLLAAGAFALVASSIYILNDLEDWELDRQHQHKRSRPLAAGTVSPKAAVLLLIPIMTTGLALGYWVSGSTLMLLSIYVVSNIIYTKWLKDVVILDVFVLASGFVLRILVGTVGVGIPPSNWLLLCGIMLALFFGFSKRQAELTAAPSTGGMGREVLQHYSGRTLDRMLATTAGAVLVTYALYTVDEATVLEHHTEALIYTVPIVAYGLFRFLYLLDHCKMGQDFSGDLFKDSHLLATVFVWILAVLIILSGLEF